MVQRNNRRVSLPQFLLCFSLVHSRAIRGSLEVKFHFGVPSVRNGKVPVQVHFEAHFSEHRGQSCTVYTSTLFSEVSHHVNQDKPEHKVNINYVKILD